MVLLPIILKLLLALSVAVPISLTDYDGEFDPGRRRSVLLTSPRPDEWTCVVPYFNEARVIERCLVSLAAQSSPPKVILVDNGSTDIGRRIAERCCTANGLQFESVAEPTPGKVAALAKGLAATTTTFVATCDADTYYPPDYLFQAGLLLNRPSVVAAGAVLISDRRAKFRGLFERFHLRMAARVAPWQCHSGGAGQVFRTDALRKVDGFDPRIWNLVLEDHEVIARVGMTGIVAYDSGFWCNPLTRLGRHERVGWSLSERVCYHMTARRSMPAYFAGYLAPRLVQREQWNIKLRPNGLLADANLERSFAPTTLIARVEHHARRAWAVAATRSF